MNKIVLKHEVELVFVQGDAIEHTGYPLEPANTAELMIAYRELDEESGASTNPRQRQVHLIGTASALEELGTFLIALARCTTTDPEPYASLEDVRWADGGTVRLLPRRIASNP